MERRVLGVIVAGSLGSPLGRLGAPDDLALLPFAGRYRMVDFALATLLNSGVRDIHWCAPRWATALTAYLHRAVNDATGRARLVLPLAASAEGAGRVYRLLAALETARPLVRALQVETIVVLAADHVLRLDLRHLLDVHHACGADATLPAVPLAAGDAGGRLVLEVDPHDRVTEVRRPPVSTLLPPDGDGFVLAWSGDLVVRAAALPALLGPMSAPAVSDDTVSLGALAATLHLRTHDVFDVGGRATGGGMRTYWHDPDTVDADYIAQMELCVSRSPLDLSDPTWPLPTGATAFAP